MSQLLKSHHSLVAIAFLVLAGLSGGCSSPTQPTGRRIDDVAPEKKPAKTLPERIDEALEFTIRERRLDSKEQAGWQVLHGILAFGQEFPLRHQGADVQALEYLLTGGKLKGWNLSEGDILDETTGRRGVRALVERGSITGQGHRDQWIGYLAQSGQPLSTRLIVEGKEHNFDDYMRQVELDVYQNADQEFSWTLMALAAFRPTEHTWKAGDGSDWSVAKVLEIETAQDPNDSPCGGMHRLSGMAMARQKRIDEKLPLDGAWGECDTKIRSYLKKIEKHQNPDGCFSTNYLARGGAAVDLPNAMHCSGHTLEFVILSSTDEELKQPWIENAVSNMCDLFHRTERLDLECGALYHAAHALVLYRQRMFGGRSYLEGAGVGVGAREEQSKDAAKTE